MDKLPKDNSTPFLEGNKILSNMDNHAQALEQACQYLVFNYQAQLVRYVMALGQLNEDVANEIVSNVIVHIWEKGDTIRVKEMEKPLSYLFRAVTNRYLDYKKKTDRERKEALEYMVGNADHQDETFSEQWSIRARIAAAMRGLTDQQRLAVLFTRVEGKSHEEAAAEMGISASTVKKHLKVALSKLRKSLKELYALLILFSLMF